MRCAVPRNVLLLQQQMKETEEEVEAAVVVVAVGESLGESARGVAKAKAAHTKRPPVVTHHPRRSSGGHVCAGMARNGNRAGGGGLGDRVRPLPFSEPQFIIF